MGAFGVELETRRGAASFLRQSRGILGANNRALWVTAQGRFADVRQRPLGLQPGIAHLADLTPTAVLLPLAIDYVFWEERGAEALVAFGDPLRASELRAAGRSARLATLEDRLTRTLDRLAADAISREPQRFETLIGGQAGVGGIYDLWRRGRAIIRGERFDPAHNGSGGTSHRERAL
jgi:hypothetical protein